MPPSFSSICCLMVLYTFQRYCRHIMAESRLLVSTVLNTKHTVYNEIAVDRTRHGWLLRLAGLFGLKTCSTIVHNNRLMYLEMLSMSPQCIICLQAICALMLWHRAKFAILIFVFALRGWRPQRRPKVLWTADPCFFDILFLVEQGDAHPAFQNP